MDIESIFKYRKDKIKKIKVTDEGYMMLKIFVDEIVTSKNKPLEPIAKFNSIPIEIDNNIKTKMEVVYEEDEDAR